MAELYLGTVLQENLCHRLSYSHHCSGHHCVFSTQSHFCCPVDKMLTGPGEKIQMMDREKCDGYESDPARQKSLQPVSQHAEEGGQV